MNWHIVSKKAQIYQELATTLADIDNIYNEYYRINKNKLNNKNRELERIKKQLEPSSHLGIDTSRDPSEQ